MKITPANIHYTDQGTPRSEAFEDVYFSDKDGIAETHYVFIEGNNLLANWEACTASHFCIGETGFGTGLNFFCTAALFLTFLDEHPHHPLKHLHFISTEKYPIPKTDAAKILAKWATFADLCSWWLAHYPLAIEGIHRRQYKNCITLDVHYNDATEAFSTLKKTFDGTVDAWFLDGFAPARNNAMWSPELFSQLARLSKSHATLATFSAASKVKKQLREAGFVLNKRKGFRYKREMIAAEYINKGDTPEVTLPEQQAPYFERHPFNDNRQACSTRGGSNKPEQASVIGNGLAGAIMALKLVNENIVVDLYWQGDKPADGASGAPIGGFYPQLNAQNNYASRLQLASFLYAKSFYTHLASQTMFDYDWCGALQLGFNANTETRLAKLDNLALWPKDIAHIVSAEQATQIANLDVPYNCLYMPEAGWISPASLVQACLNEANKTGLLHLHSNSTLVDYTHINDAQIQLNIEHEERVQVRNTQCLVLATGASTKSLLADTVPLRLTRGQVELVKSEGSLRNLQTLLCHKGYLTPALNEVHALGSTYVKQDTNTETRHSETQQNFAMHADSMRDASWIDELNKHQTHPQNYARAAVRCSSPDHLPVVGAVPSTAQFNELADLYKALPLQRYQVPSVEQNVFVLSGLGSRGLTTAPLLAELLTSQIVNRPLPLPGDLLNALQPNRFIVRSLIKRQALYP